MKKPARKQPQKRNSQGAPNKAACAFANLVYGLRAPFEGAVRGVLFGLRLSPKMGTFLDLLTCYAVPFTFASTLGLAGLLGGVLCLCWSVAEAFKQFLIYEPYDYPHSRVFIDWIPKG